MTKQLQGIKLAVFDYDGTITREDETTITSSAMYGLNALRSSGILTTTITARPFQRLRTISEGIENIVSFGISLATERGARIIDGSKSKNLYYVPLAHSEHEAIASMVMDSVDFIGFYPEDLYGTSYIWTPQQNRRDEMESLYGHDAIVLAGGINKLRVALKSANPCLATIRFNSEQASNHSLLPGWLNTAWSSRAVSVVSEGIDKATALRLLCSSVTVPLGNVLYAGNDNNDTPILCMPELGKRILVGGREVLGIADPFMRVASPELLGECLGRIAEEQL